jgi:hypothetical protein
MQVLNKGVKTNCLKYTKYSSAGWKRIVDFGPFC